MSILSFINKNAVQIEYSMITYIARNTINGKFYIGSTLNFEKRKREHLNRNKNYPFQNSLRKNPDIFEWEIYEDDCDEPILEQSLLDMWFGKEQCYNLNPYADRPSLETSVKNGKNAYKNKTGIFSLEFRNSEKYIEHQKNAGKIGGQKIAKEKVGFCSPDYIKSEEYKQIRVKNGINFYKNKIGLFSEEYQNSLERKLMIEKLSKKILAISPDGEELSFPSINNAALNLNMHRQTISKYAHKQKIIKSGEYKGWKVIFIKKDEI